MSTSTFEIFGKIAGLAGLSLAIFLLLFRDFIRAKFFPKLKADHAYKLIRLFLVLTTIITVFGISVWVWTNSFQSSSQTKAYDSILDQMVVDFQNVADDFFIDVKRGAKDYSSVSEQYDKIDSKINSIIVRSNSMEESDERYGIISRQAQIVRNSFKRLNNLHQQQKKLSPVFVDEVRKIYDRFSEEMQGLSSVK